METVLQPPKTIRNLLGKGGGVGVNSRLHDRLSRDLFQQIEMHEDHSWRSVIVWYGVPTV